MITTGRLKDGITEVTPRVTGRGSEGHLQLNVSRVTHNNNNNTEHPELSSYLPRFWAYLSVQVNIYYTYDKKFSY